MNIKYIMYNAHDYSVLYDNVVHLVYVRVDIVLTRSASFH